MIDLVAWPASVRLFIVLLPFTFLIIGTATQAFIAHSRYFNALRRAFRRSSGFEDEINCWGASTLRSRILVVSAMSLAVIYPSLGIRHGWLSVEDSEEFPRRLRWMLLISTWSLLLGFLILGILIAFVKVTNT
ncbi:hypothetical protein HU720_10345 [Pseudomonas sp. SWRI51]|uniref:hypothetical protein n=1 Tax=Pseudomonas sp. SWRI51 TaxID=2745491 RepID=UPI001648878D|nr:hypothetical protein [Pseudomonas sp. SWRI51]MBC3411700.1 hypothetical protein [Pseudomonas sp. SWRI51]